MHLRVITSVLVVSLTLLACRSAAQPPAPRPEVVYTPTPTRTPEPNLAAGTCVFTAHPDAVTRDNKHVGPGDPVIKGIVNESGLKVYYVPGMRRYTVVKVDESGGGKWFCREPEAEQAGWRSATEDRNETPAPRTTPAPPR